MKHPLTGEDMILTPRREEVEYKGEKVSYWHWSYDEYTTTELDEINLENIIKNYEDNINQRHPRIT